MAQLSLYEALPVGLTGKKQYVIAESEKDAYQIIEELGADERDGRKHTPKVGPNLKQVKIRVSKIKDLDISDTSQITEEMLPDDFTVYNHPVNCTYRLQNSEHDFATFKAEFDVGGFFQGVEHYEFDSIN